MRCPFCGNEDTQVKDSRPTEDNTSIRRRRACINCGGRFTTFERIQMRELTVIKRNGQRVLFERDKLVRSMAIALRKRPVEPDRVDRVIDVSEAEARNQTKRLAREEGILAGMSSGGALTAALKIAGEIDRGVIVFIVCDRGDRYLSSDLFV